MEFVYHKLNLLLAKAVYLFTSKTDLSLIKERRFLKGNRFFITNTKSRMQNDSDLIKMLNQICEYTEKFEKTSLYPQYVLKKNYSCNQYGLANQKHCDCLPSELISGLGQCLEKSDVIKLAESYMKCRFSVVNLRSWVFYPKNTDQDDSVHKHFDGLRKGTLKIMYYAGNFESQPALTIYENDKEHHVLGENPLVLFEPNRLLHGALAPKINPRPTVELTLSPRFSRRVVVQQAGFQAGTPRNPLKNYTENSGLLHS